MTLYRQLVLVLITLFILMFAGTYLANIGSIRTFLVAQLESHAQDTATSLGLSLSPHLTAGDQPTMRSMVDAIFDRGYYREISVQGADGAVLIERKIDVTVANVPVWFVDKIALETPRASAVVMSGWKPGATVYVHSHPGYAYNELWQSTTRMALWFGLTTVVASVLGALALRILLRPLKSVERQAEAISARQYDVQGNLPRTRELRNVVLAMNRMTGKVKEMFEEHARNAERFRRLAYEDALTGLGNRRYFDAQLENTLGAGDEHSGGALLLLQLHGLKQLNDRYGYSRGDAILGTVGEILARETLLFGRRVLARTGGSGFAVLLPGTDAVAAEQLAARLCDTLIQLHTDGLTESPNVGHIGVATWHQVIDKGQLLDHADQAMHVAQSAAPNGWARFHPAGSAVDTGIGRQQRIKQLADAIENRRIVLYAQPVLDSRRAGHVLHNEVLGRILDDHANVFPAAHFLPLAEQLGVIGDIDRIVTADGLRFASGSSTSLAINLSPVSLRNTAFQDWITGALRDRGAMPRVIFEVSELGAVQEIEQIRRFTAAIQSLGHGFALDHFGRAFSSFGYLQSLRPDYVKIDGAYTKDILENKDNQFYVESLCSVAHSLDILTIAERVETRAQWDMLKALNVDGIQGHAAGMPRNLREVN